MNDRGSIADMLLKRDEDDPFSPIRVRRWKKFAKSVDALPDFLSKRPKKKKEGGVLVNPEARLRAANKVPEAIVKVASYGAGKASAVGQLDYISRDGTIELEMNDGSILDGKEDIRDLIEHWEESFHYRKGGSRNTMHMVVSAPDGSDPEAVLQAGRDFAEATFGDNHPYALVRHDDGLHPHVHIVTRMRGDDGEMFRIERGGFHALRETFAEACRENDIEMNATPREVRGTARSEPMALRKMREDGRTPDIDGRATQLVLQERELPELARASIFVREAALKVEASEHRALASAFDSIASSDSAEGRAFEREAEKLRNLAAFLEEGGHRTRPEKIREQRRDMMTDKVEPGQEPDMKKRPSNAPSVGGPAGRDPVDGQSLQGRDTPSPEQALEIARLKAERGAVIAREMANALPEGPDKETAERAMRNLDRAADRLHGREPEPDMKADARDRNVEPGGSVSAPGDQQKSRVDPVPGSAEHARQEMDRIMKKQRERDNDPDRDWDRDRD